MERRSTPTRRVTPSDPASSRKRTSSPCAFTPSAKKSKAESSRGNPDKDKKRKRRKKKQPITRDVEMSSGLKDHSSPQSSFSTASSSTQMNSVGSLTPVSGDLPPISLPDRSPPVASPSTLHHEMGRSERHGTLQQQSAMQSVESESKVCLPSLCV